MSTRNAGDQPPVAADPIELFIETFARARALDPQVVREPSAMVVATADSRGRPSARFVLLKSVDARGFTFYTNMESRKGRELLANPWAALCFYWFALDVQIRVEGPAAQVDDTEADEYFATRPRGSQLGAWASRQSASLDPPDALHTRLAKYEADFAEAEVPRPPFWSGFRIDPQVIEFWYNRPSRLHDRVLYTRAAGTWRAERLYP